MAHNLCVICMEDLSSDHAHTLEPCSHTFHSTCLIGWFQRGHLSCPTCRADAHHDALPAMALRERASYIRRTLGRRSSAPVELKRLLSKLRAAEELQRERQREYTDFQREQSDVLKRVKLLRTRKWSAMRTASKYERLLGLYQCPSLPLPAVMVTQLH